MKNAALAGILAICLMALLAIAGVTKRDDNTAKIREKLVSPKVAVVGDIMLGRQVGRLMDTYGYDYALSKIVDFLDNFDLAVGNFEGTVLEEFDYAAGMQLKFSTSLAALTQLVNANFGVLSLANNHGFDYGREGFEESKNNLQAVGISPIGHPYDLSNGIVTTVEVNNRILKFVAFNATVPDFDTSSASELVKNSRIDSPEAVIIVIIHWGDEYKATHNDKQEYIGQLLIDAGSDVIFGSHPHVVQDIASYDDKLIFYSLGNFVFDQNFSTETMEGLLVGIQLNATSTEFGLFPVDLSHSQPKLMPKDVRRRFLNDLAAKSPKDLRDEIKSGIIVR